MVEIVDIQNAKAHEFLTDEGAYVHTHYPAEFDDGTPESGPGTWNCDSYDSYSGDSHTIILDHGKLAALFPINWDEVRFFEGFEESCPTEADMDSEPGEEYDFDPAPKFDGF